MTKLSKLEETLNIELRHLGLRPQRQFRFCERRWLFDFAWPDIKLAVEVEGGTWSGGRHTRPKGYAGDCEKYNTASLSGWTVLRYTSDMVRSGEAAKEIQEAVKLLTAEHYCVE